jgi:hypothetical protein
MARPENQSTNLALGIVREFLQPVGRNVRLDDSISPSLAGFEIGTQQSCEK